MLWFFCKQNARVQYEIRRQSDGDEFELVITRDGREQIEKFADARAFVERSRLLRESLLASGWSPPEEAAAMRSRLRER